MFHRSRRIVAHSVARASRPTAAPGLAGEGIGVGFDRLLARVILGGRKEWGRMGKEA